MESINITSKPEGVTIELSGMGEEKSVFLDAFSGCESGECACASDEYAKVESMQVHDLGNAITVNVLTKEGESIDPSCITDCLTSIQEQATSG